MLGSRPSASAARGALVTALVRMRTPCGNPLMSSNSKAGPPGCPAATSVMAPISNCGSAPSTRRSAPSCSTASMNSRRSLYIVHPSPSVVTAATGLEQRLFFQSFRGLWRREFFMTESPSWHIVGDWFDNCSCAVACPCTFAQAPDNGFCESVLFWHVREGHYGDVKLDNLSFVRVGRWEGDLWARKATGVAGLYIDDHADDRQMEALPAIIGGRAGGFPGWVNECFAGGRQSRGIERAKITYEIAPDLGHWGVEIVGKVKAWAKAIIGPTSPPGKYPQLMNAPGSETGPGPQLVTWGKSTILSVDAL